MGRITKIAGKRYTVNARNSITYYAKGDGGIAINSASNTNYSTGGNYVLADYGEQEKEEEESGKYFLSAYWSYDQDGKHKVSGDDNHSFRTTLEKTVYFQLNVGHSVPTGRTIQFQLYDYDTGLFMDWINPDDKEFGGREIIKTGKVRETNGKNG